MASLEEALTRSLQCPICLELLTAPKLLSCAHTFCTSCIILLCKSREDGDAVLCPICRETTIVKDGDRSQLQMNLQVKALVNEVAEVRQSCTHCLSKNAASPAVSYCHDCKTYMCVRCQNKHAQWKPNATHRVSTVDDIRHGKVVVKKTILCQEHDAREGEQECTDVCLTCRKTICIRCRVLDHEKRGHVVQGAVEYTTNMKAQIKALQGKVKTKAAGLKNHIIFVEEQKKQITAHIKKRKAEIDDIFQESVRKLNESRKKRKKQCDVEREKLLAELDKMRAIDESTIESIESTSELAGNSLNAPLEGDIVDIRHSLCNKIDDMIRKCDPCLRDAANLSRRAGKMAFKENRGRNELDLGQIEYSDAWKLKTDLKLSCENSMNYMAATPDGRMAVGSRFGGIEIYTSEGQFQQTVLKYVCVRALGFLSDGRFVVIGGNNVMSLYTAHCEKIHERFETLSDDEGGIANVTVNSDDLMYVTYMNNWKIHVFTPAGGKPVRAIISGAGFGPEQIFTMNSKRMLLVKDAYSVRVIDDQGVVKHKVTKEGVYPYPAVSRDDTILIAWIKDEGLVSIDQYTNELNHVKTLIKDHKIEKPERGWFYMQEYLSGEIALCTPDRLYIFH